MRSPSSNFRERSSGQLSSRAAQTARDLTPANCLSLKHCALSDVHARHCAKAVERLWGPSPSARLGMTRTLWRIGRTPLLPEHFFERGGRSPQRNFVHLRDFCPALPADFQSHDLVEAFMGS